jgi:hypothetical protein
MTAWRLAPSLTLLKTTIDRKWPGRLRTFDGTIGDARHQAEKSDHNPNERGVVCAMDITHDPLNGPDGKALAEALRASRNPRISYVIHAGQIFSSTVSPWEWRIYPGEDPHKHHVHVSVRDVVSDDFPWKIS